LLHLPERLAPLKPIFCSCLLLAGAGVAQPGFPYATSNYAGIPLLYVNPASAAGNVLKADAIFFGFDLELNNSWFAIRREALDYDGSLLRPAGWKFPPSWKNQVPGVENNVFKNFRKAGSADSYSVIISSRLMLPSAMYSIDDRQAVAFTWNRRQIGNLDGISNDIAYLFENELDLSVVRNNRVRDSRLSAIQMTWVEYGLTYARTLIDERHTLKAGVTPKLVQGVESVYLIIDNLDFLLSNKDTLSYAEASFTYGRSGSGNKPFRVNPTFGQTSGSGSALALDLGFIYEWRPHLRKVVLKPGESSAKNKRRDYRVKAGVSVTDIGKLKFRKTGVHYDLDISLRQNNVIRYTTITKASDIDSLLKIDFPPNTGSGEFEIFLPAAVNLQTDVLIYKWIFVNVSAHMADLYHNQTFRVHDYSVVTLSPRFEHYWFDVGLPLTWNALSARRGRAVAAGLNLRGGPLTLGTTDLQPALKGDVAGLSFYFSLRAPIPYFERNQTSIKRPRPRK
jgi:hypothetical protein